MNFKIGDKVILINNYGYSDCLFIGDTGIVDSYWCNGSEIRVEWDENSKRLNWLKRHRFKVFKAEGWLAWRFKKNNIGEQLQFSFMDS